MQLIHHSLSSKLFLAGYIKVQNRSLVRAASLPLEHFPQCVVPNGSFLHSIFIANKFQQAWSKQCVGTL